MLEWNLMFPSDRQPTMDEIEIYIGGEARILWRSLMDYMEQAYKIKPKLSYSICSGKPGWNIKFKKRGQAFGTLYPEENSFSVLLVISYKLTSEMEELLPELTKEMAYLYQEAGDYMKIGKWMMFQVKNLQNLEDYKKILSIKMVPQNVS